jgi:hypothetical protein
VSQGILIGAAAVAVEDCAAAAAALVAHGGDHDVLRVAAALDSLLRAAAAAPIDLRPCEDASLPALPAPVLPALALPGPAPLLRSREQGTASGAAAEAALLRLIGPSDAGPESESAVPGGPSLPPAAPSLRFGPAAPPPAAPTAAPLAVHQSDSSAWRAGGEGGPPGVGRGRWAGDGAAGRGGGTGGSGGSVGRGGIKGGGDGGRGGAGVWAAVLARLPAMLLPRKAVPVVRSHAEAGPAPLTGQHSPADSDSPLPPPRSNSPSAAAAAAAAAVAAAAAAARTPLPPGVVVGAEGRDGLGRGSGLYVIGGWDGTCNVARMDRLRPAGEGKGPVGGGWAWEECPPMSRPRRGVAACVPDFVDACIVSLMGVCRQG